MRPARPATSGFAGRIVVCSRLRLAVPAARDAAPAAQRHDVAVP